MKFLILFALALATTSVVPISAIKGRITNGTNANVGQFPYQVGLSGFLEGKPFRCGGSLIGHRWVLTTAGCTTRVTKLNVYLGAIKFESPELNYTVNSSAFFIHPGYDFGYGYNDIALIQIPYTNFTTNIDKVELPPISSSILTYEGSYATVSGWGQTSDSSRNMSTYLQWGPMQVISNTDCANRTFWRINSSKICAASADHVSFCRGDIGGPLVWDTIKILIGLASHHEVNCERGYPDVFTRVTSYLDWIWNITTSSFLNDTSSRIDLM